MGRVSTKIKAVSEILTDENGFYFIDVELQDGTIGFYPGEKEALSFFKPGSEVSYMDTKKFNNRNKINGLIMENNKEEVSGAGVIVSITNVTMVKGFFSRAVQLDNGVSANVISKQAAGVSVFREGNLVSYTGLTDAGEHGIFFDNLKKEFLYNAEERRQLSIVRQSSLKIATELYLSSGMLDRIKNGDEVNWDNVSDEIIKISEKFIGYSLVD